MGTARVTAWLCLATAVALPLAGALDGAFMRVSVPGSATAVVHLDRWVAYRAIFSLVVAAAAAAVVLLTRTPRRARLYGLLAAVQAGRLVLSALIGIAQYWNVDHGRAAWPNRAPGESLTLGPAFAAGVLCALLAAVGVAAAWAGRRRAAPPPGWPERGPEADGPVWPPPAV
jgi:hypothetical protein